MAAQGVREVSRTYLYRFFDDKDQLLYIGISKTVLARMAQHFQTKDWIPDTGYLKWSSFDERWQAEIAERRAIVVEKPIWNVMFNEENNVEDERTNANLAGTCIRVGASIEHWGGCRLVLGGNNYCPWTNDVVEEFFCCRIGFDQACYPNGNPAVCRYRHIMKTYLNQYVTMAVFTKTDWPAGTNATPLVDCGKHK